MPQVHDLKQHPDPFKAVLTRAKKFEFRKNDRDFQVGDTLRLREWDPGCTVCAVPFMKPRTGPCGGEARGYTGSLVMAKVTYIVYGPAFGVPEGFCVMSIDVMSEALS